MRINQIKTTDKLGNEHPTQVYELDGRKVRIKFIQHTAPHLYLVSRNINAQADGKPDWAARPDMDTYEFVTKRFDFLVPSYAQYVDKKTGERKTLTGARGTRAFLSSPERVKESLKDFNDNFEIWKRREITRKELKGNILAIHVTECLIYDEAEWQRDPPKFVEKEDSNGVKKRVLLDAGTRPQFIARGISACAEGEQYIRKAGNLKARGRAFSNYKHKFGSTVNLALEDGTPVRASASIKQALAGKSDQEILDLLTGAGK
jgi:hypothetical protein